MFSHPSPTLDDSSTEGPRINLCNLLVALRLLVRLAVKSSPDSFTICAVFITAFPPHLRDENAQRRTRGNYLLEFEAGGSEEFAKFCFCSFATAGNRQH